MISLLSIQKSRGPDIYYEEGYRKMIEDHLAYLRGHAKTSMVQLNPAIVGACVGDLTGILDNLGLARQYHWTVMRINAINTPSEVDDTLTALLLPDLTTIEQLKNIYSTKRSNSIFS